MASSRWCFACCVPSIVIVIVNHRKSASDGAMKAIQTTKATCEIIKVIELIESFKGH